MQPSNGDTMLAKWKPELNPCCDCGAKIQGLKHIIGDFSQRRFALLVMATKIKFLNINFVYCNQNRYVKYFNTLSLLAYSKYDKTHGFGLFYIALAKFELTNLFKRDCGKLDTLAKETHINHFAI